ncbi:MAG: MFS transporter, partial [Candidatus Bathyarchaeia archaeon]
VFIASIIPGVISILLLVMFVKERREGVSLEKSGVRVAFRALGRRFRVYILTVIAFTIGNLSYAFFLLRAQDFGIKPDHAPLLYLLFNLVYAFSAFPVGYASDKLGKKPILLLGYIMFSVTCAGFASASSLPQVILLFVLYGASYALSDTLQRALVPDIVDAKLRGTAFGALHMSIGAAALPSSLLAGLLWQRLGAPAAFSMATAAVAFSAFMLGLFVKSGPN